MEADMSIFLMTWFGFGKDECYGSTCMLGQFCSKDRLYKECRNCSDISEWCQVNRTHLATKFPSCYYICAENALKETNRTLQEFLGEENAINKTNRTLQGCFNNESGFLTLDWLHYVLAAAVFVLFVMLLLILAFPWEKLKQQGKHILHIMGLAAEAPRRQAEEGVLLGGHTPHVLIDNPHDHPDSASSAESGCANQRDSPTAAESDDERSALHVHGSAMPGSFHDDAPNNLRAPCPVQDGSGQGSRELAG